jgi:hypothetical protein
MKLTFESIDYANWQSAYTPYGITFVGGTLEQTYGNHYVAGDTTMFFDPAAALDRVSFRGDAARLDNMIWAYIDGKPFEPTLFESMSYSPLTPTGKITDWTPGMMWDGRVFTEGRVNEIRFTGLIALDDIQLNATPIASASAIPEPSTLALVLTSILLLKGLRHVRIPSQA